MSRNGSRAVAASTSRHEPTTVMPHFRDDAWSNARYDVTPAALSDCEHAGDRGCENPR